MADIRIKDLPLGTPSATKLLPMDLTTTERASIRDIVFSGRPSASQAEAEAGVDAEKVMTPLTTKQAIDFNVSLAGMTGDYNDLINRPDVPSVRQLPFTLTLGQSFVTIEDGYDVGTVYQVFINGLLLDNSDWSAVDGSTVTFPAVTSNDIAEGESSVSMVVTFGVVSALIPLNDNSYLPSYYDRSVAQGKNLNAYSEVEIRRWSSTSRLSKAVYQKVGAAPSHPFWFQDGVGNYFELAAREVDPVTVGAKGDWNGSSGTDDGPILQSLFNSGYKALINYKHAVNNTITVTAPCDIELSINSGLYWQRAVGSVAASLLFINTTAIGSRIYGFGVIDGREDIIQAINPTDPYLGSLIRIASDRTQMNNVFVRRSWDNGIAVGATPFSGHPFGVTLTDIRTEFCGLGNHTNPETPGHAGGGIDIATGVACVITGHVDLGSSNAIILDVGAGAQCVVSNCQGWYNDLTYYFGASDCLISNCMSVFATGYTDWAIWVDQPNIRLINVQVYNAQKHGFLIKGGDVSLNACSFKNVGLATANTYSGVLIDSGEGSGTGIINIGVGDFAAMGTTHRSSIKTIGGKTIVASVESLSPLSGATAPFEIGNPAIHEITKYGRAAG